MGLRLLILNLWTPKYIIRRELENISVKTTAALTALASECKEKATDALNEKKQPRTIDEQRAIMAQTQARLVEILKSKLGQEEAVKLGRQALFLVGQSLGREARSSLGVSDSSSDLTRAAKILYRILGIDFHLEWNGKSNATLVIDRCALADQYSNLTCEVLCATDEGVINGLQPKVTMRFKEFMTKSCKNCRAQINLEKVPMD